MNVCTGVICRGVGCRDGNRPGVERPWVGKSAGPVFWRFGGPKPGSPLPWLKLNPSVC